MDVLLEITRPSQEERQDGGGLSFRNVTLKHSSISSWGSGQDRKIWRELA